MSLRDLTRPSLLEIMAYSATPAVVACDRDVRRALAHVIGHQARPATLRQVAKAILGTFGDPEGDDRTAESLERGRLTVRWGVVRKKSLLVLALGVGRRTTIGFAPEQTRLKLLSGLVAGAWPMLNAAGLRWITKGRRWATQRRRDRVQTGSATLVRWAQVVQQL